MRYAQPGQPGSVVPVSPRYENFIDGKWVSPALGQYMTNLAPATAKPICEVAKSTPEDVETALDAAHHAKDEWGQTSPAERARVLNAIADAIDAHPEMLAVAESWENGKPVRETLAADIPLAADHFRYFAAAISAQETKITEIDAQTDRLPLPGAARRGRADHPVQLPAPDGGVEDRAGARGRELHGHQAARRRPRGRS